MDGPDQEPIFDTSLDRGSIKPGEGFDAGSVAVGAVVGAVSMLLASLAMGGVDSQSTIIILVASAGATVSIPAGIVTGLLSSAAETELQHGGFAGLFGTLFGLGLAAGVEFVLSPHPTFAGKPDILYLTVTRGLGTYVVVFPVVFVVGGYAAKYTATLRWELFNDDDQEWGTKGRFEDDER
jgi:hypothetical protein